MSSTAYTRHPKEEDLALARQTQMHLRQYRENGGKVIPREDAPAYDVKREKGPAGRIARGELPMSDPTKPIQVRPFVNELNCCLAQGLTAQNIYGFIFSRLDSGEVILRADITDDESVIMPITTKTVTEDWVRDFLMAVNEARLYAPRPRIERSASGPPKLGRVVNKSQFVHPDIVAHALIAYWQQRYWLGMFEAARRSQSAPGWLRWEMIQVRPTRKSLQLELIQGGLKSLAEKARRTDNLAAARIYTAPTTLLSMQRNPYLGAPTGDALAAHIVLYEVFGYNEVDLLVIYILERLDCWRNPRLADRVKDYSNDRHYIDPQELKFIALGGEVKIRRTTEAERRAWAIARAQGEALVDEMATWPKWREAA